MHSESKNLINHELVGYAFRFLGDRCHAAGMQRDSLYIDLFPSCFAGNRYLLHRFCVGADNRRSRAWLWYSRMWDYSRSEAKKMQKSPKGPFRMIATHVLVEEEEEEQRDEERKRRRWWRAAASCFVLGDKEGRERDTPPPGPLHVWFQALLRCVVFRRWWQRKHGMRLRRVRRRKGWWEGFPSKSRRAAGGSRGERTHLCSAGCSVEEKRKKKHTTGWASGRGEEGA